MQIDPDPGLAPFVSDRSAGAKGATTASVDAGDPLAASFAQFLADRDPAGPAPASPACPAGLANPGALLRTDASDESGIAAGRDGGAPGNLAGASDRSEAADASASPVRRPLLAGDSQDLTKVGDLQGLAVACLPVPLQSEPAPASLASTVSIATTATPESPRAETGAVEAEQSGRGRLPPVEDDRGIGRGERALPCVASRPGTPGPADEFSPQSPERAAVAPATELPSPIGSRPEPVQPAWTAPAIARGATNLSTANQVPLPAGAAERAGVDPAVDGVDRVVDPTPRSRPASRPHFLDTATAEKFAAAGKRAAHSAPPDGRYAAKSFVATGAKELTSIAAGLGIAGAEPRPTMSAGATSARPLPPDPAVVLAATPVVELPPERGPLPVSLALAGAAHRAVEAALRTTDRFADRDQHAVNLQFSFGSTDLHVRVELRAGEVRTTFQTDSADLRAALSDEWRALTAQPADRPVRLASPVFTAAGSAGGAGPSLADHGAARQQHHGSPEAMTAAFARTPTPSRASAGGPTPAVVPRPATPHSVHLHTFA